MYQLLYSCLNCVTITGVPTLTAAQRCKLRNRVGGFRAFFLVFCGVRMTSNVPNQDPLAAFLAGADMPLSDAAITIALANGAPVGTTTANIIEAAQWKLLGFLGDSVRGGITRQDAITHQNGSCKMPTIANNTWRLNIGFPKVGGSGENADYDMLGEWLMNPDAYHLVGAECGERGEIVGGVVLPAASYSLAEYNFTRPEDGIREFVTRGISVDFVQLQEPKSYAFTAYDELTENF